MKWFLMVKKEKGWGKVGEKKKKTWFSEQRKGPAWCKNGGVEGWGKSEGF